MRKSPYSPPDSTPPTLVTKSPNHPRPPVLLLKDSRYPLVLGAKKLVQLQVKVINLFSSFALVTLLILIIPIIITDTDFYKSDKYPSFVKENTISYAFITYQPTIIFLHTGQEILQNRLLLNNIRTSSIICYVVHYGVLNMVDTIRPLHSSVLQVPTPLPHHHANPCYCQ
eukprot:bmy_18192T0